MISSIHLEHFKCFADLRLAFAPLTLLSGVNSAGKSSVIQPLVLLHQTLMDSDRSKSLVLNGPLLRMGRFVDVVDELEGRDTFAIGVTANETSIHWLFRSTSKDALVANVSERVVTVRGRQLSDSNLDDRSFFPRLLNSGDLPPQDLEGIEGSLAELNVRFPRNVSGRVKPTALIPGFTFSSSGTLNDMLRETQPAGAGFSDTLQLGSGGELTPWVLLQYGDRQVHPLLCLDATTTLARQVEARLADFSRVLDWM